jgi:hypothetical protein
MSRRGPHNGILGVRYHKTTRCGSRSFDWVTPVFLNEQPQPERQSQCKILGDLGESWPETLFACCAQHLSRRHHRQGCNKPFLQAKERLIHFRVQAFRSFFFQSYCTFFFFLGERLFLGGERKNDSFTWNSWLCYRDYFSLALGVTSSLV